ncbi:MAG TPA: hypothetical protein VEI97_02320 [bacterium]|nr:hypothetical protein [bacterium]
MTKPALPKPAEIEAVYELICSRVGTPTPTLKEMSEILDLPIHRAKAAKEVLVRSGRVRQHFDGSAHLTYELLDGASTLPRTNMSALAAAAADREHPWPAVTGRPDDPATYGAGYWAENLPVKPLPRWDWQAWLRRQQSSGPGPNRGGGAANQN